MRRERDACTPKPRAIEFLGRSHVTRAASLASANSRTARYVRSITSMASGGYYDDQSVSRYGYGYGYGYSRPSQSSSSFHMCLFLATASLLGAASLYSRCESAMESLFDQLRLVVVLSPLLLLLAAQYWTAAAASGRGRWSSSRGAGLSSSLLVAPLVGEQRPWYEQPQRGDGAGAASSPWGVALALALVLLLISYQSCFQDWWFPLVSRRR